MACTLAAIYGMSVLYNTSLANMTDFHIRPKFLVMKVVLIITNLQGGIISMLVTFKVITCVPPLNADATGRRKYFDSLLYSHTVEYLLLID